MSLTDLEAIRLKIGDTDSSLFSDDELNYFLEENDNNTDLAGAAALEALAADAAKVAKIEKSATWETSKISIPKALADAAKRLREQYERTLSGIASTPYSAEVEAPVYPWETYYAGT